MEGNKSKSIYGLYPDRGSYVAFTCYPLVPSTPLPQTDDKRFLMDLLDRRKGNGEPKAVYIHIPFCDSICTFCPFTKILKKERKVEKYLQALRAEIELYSKSTYVKSSEFHAIYFGGGTPTCLSVEQLVDILSCLKRSLNIHQGAEITIEGCTWNSDEAKLRLLTENGVNRFSFGVQTFKDSVRKLLNLQDDAAHIAETIEAAHRWCNNVDIDLIYNLPGQTLDDWQTDLEKAVGLKVESIMCHSLEVHPTKLARQLQKGEVPPIGSGVLEIDMYLNATEFLQRAGYSQWSVTHWMLPGKVFKYEREIRAGPYDYLGLGLGSSSRIAEFLCRNIGVLHSYITTASSGRFPMAGAVKLSREDAMRAYVLRRLVGALSIKRQDFRELFREMLEDVFPQIINSLKQRGLILADDSEIRLSSLGIVWAGKVCEEFCSSEFLERLDQSVWLQKHWL